MVGALSGVGTIPAELSDLSPGHSRLETMNVRVRFRVAPSQKENDGDQRVPVWCHGVVPSVSGDRPA